MEWIKVKDKMPDRGERVIIFSVAEGVVTATYYCSQGFKEIIVEGNLQVIKEYYDVTHWKKIEEPEE